MNRAITSILIICVLFDQGCAGQRHSSIETPKVISKTGTQASAQQKNRGSSLTEAEAGAQIRNEILRSFRVYTDPEPVQYVRKINSDLAKHVQRKNLSYDVTILYSQQIYATSAPGGNIYITTGMIAFLENESELAAVIAHELGELQDKDPKLSRSRKVLNSVLNGSAAVAPAFGQIGVLALLGVAMTKTALDARVPTLEGRMYKADERAFHYMVEAGYDPQGLIDLQYRFLTAKPQLQPLFLDYYQSRPVTQERMDRISNTFEKLPIQGKQFSVNRDQFLSMTKGIRSMNAFGSVQ